MYDAKNVLIYSLVGFCTLLLVTTIFFYATPRVETVEKTKVVKVEKPYNPAKVREWLLQTGVEAAWVENFTADVKADCFAGTIQADHKSIFSYCKLRKELIPENQ